MRRVLVAEDQPAAPAVVAADLLVEELAAAARGAVGRLGVGDPVLARGPLLLQHGGEHGAVGSRALWRSATVAGSAREAPLPASKEAAANLLGHARLPWYWLLQLYGRLLVQYHGKQVTSLLPEDPGG
eukprot:2195856-Prymnesium_polylepis.1